MSPAARPLVCASVGVIEESTIARAQSTICNAMDSAGITRAELARRMGRSRAFVTQILRGSHGLTVRTLARALFACGVVLEFNLLPLAAGAESPELRRQAEAGMEAAAVIDEGAENS